MVVEKKDTEHVITLPDSEKFPISMHPGNIRKPYKFLMFSGGTEMQHWKKKNNLKEL